MKLLKTYKEKKKLKNFVKHTSDDTIKTLELVSSNQIPVLTKLPSLLEVSELKVSFVTMPSKVKDFKLSALKLRPSKLTLVLKSGFLLLSHQSDRRKESQKKKENKRNVIVIDLKQCTLPNLSTLSQAIRNDMQQCLDFRSALDMNCMFLNLNTDPSISNGLLFEFSDSDQALKVTDLIKTDIKKQDKLKRFIKTAQVGKRIGKGFFGSINLLFQGADVKVIKTVNLDKTNKSNSKVIHSKKELQEKESTYNLNYIFNERILLEELNTQSSPNVTKLLYSFELNNSLFLIYNFHKADTLLKFLEEKNNSDQYLTEKTVQYIFKSLVLALSHLHSLNIAHRDLKPENIMITKNAEIKLIDFGLSKKFKLEESTSKYEKSYEILGTIYYQAPEMLKYLGHDLSADFWQLGVVLYEMFYGKPLFNSSNLEFIEKRIKSNATIFLPNTRSVSLKARFMLLELLIREPTDRLGYQNGCIDVLSQEFLAGDIQTTQELTDYVRGVTNRYSKLVDSSERSSLQSFINDRDNVINGRNGSETKDSDIRSQNFDRLDRLGLSYVM